MEQWYRSNRKLFQDEMSALASACPLLRLVVVGPGFQINSKSRMREECAVVHGTYALHVPDTYRQIEYRIVLVLPRDYPKLPPEMFCNDLKLPIDNIDRHIMSDGKACLGVKAEMGMRWQSGSRIIDFINNFVAPFLAGQVYYDAYHEPPPWGQRSHGKKGIFEFYGEFLGMKEDSCVINFMHLLVRKNQPQGHEWCPCNSGKRLRNCHGEVVCNVRQRVTLQDVADDLAFLLRADKIE